MGLQSQQLGRGCIGWGKSTGAAVYCWALTTGLRLAPHPWGSISPCSGPGLAWLLSGASGNSFAHGTDPGRTTNPSMHRAPRSGGGTLHAGARSPWRVRQPTPWRSRMRSSFLSFPLRVSLFSSSRAPCRFGGGSTRPNRVRCQTPNTGRGRARTRARWCMRSVSPFHPHRGEAGAGSQYAGRWVSSDRKGRGERRGAERAQAHGAGTRRRWRRLGSARLRGPSVSATALFLLLPPPPAAAAAAAPPLPYCRQLPPQWGREATSEAARAMAAAAALAKHEQILVLDPPTDLKFKGAAGVGAAVATAAGWGKGRGPARRGRRAGRGPAAILRGRQRYLGPAQPRQVPGAGRGGAGSPGASGPCLRRSERSRLRLEDRPGRRWVGGSSLEAPGGRCCHVEGRVWDENFFPPSSPLHACPLPPTPRALWEYFGQCHFGKLPLCSPKRAGGTGRPSGDNIAFEISQVNWLRNADWLLCSAAAPSPGFLGAGFTREGQGEKGRVYAKAK